MRRRSFTPVPATVPTVPVSPAGDRIGPDHRRLWTWPWMLHAALIPLAFALWAWSRGDTFQATLSSTVVVVSTGGLTWLAHHLNAARGRSVQNHAAATAAYSGAWLWMFMLTGPATWAPWFVYLPMCLVGSIAWNMRRGARGQGGDHDDGYAEMLGLARSRVKDAHRDGSKVHATIQVQRGKQTWRDVAAAAKWFASWIGVREEDIHVERHKHDDAVAHVLISDEDHLAEPGPWTGPSARGKSIADAPCVVGSRESGGPLRFWLPADEALSRSLQHIVIAGMNGTGKSVCGRLITCEVGTRRDTEIWLGDPVKGRQFLGPVAHLAKHVASTGEDVMKMIAQLQALVSVRGDHLGDRGLDNWTPGCGLPFIYAHFEEIAAKIGTTRQFANLTQTARSVGISICASLQKPTHLNLSTDARSNIATVLQFGCKEGDQGWVLSKDLIQQGATPQAWTNRRPGFLYAETPGCDEGEWAKPARTAFATVADFRRLVPVAEIADHGGGDPRGVEDDQEVAVMVEPAEFIPSGKATPDEARRMFLLRLDQLRDDGHSHVRPADFEHMLRAADRSESWLNGALRQLCEAKPPVLRKARHGWYQILPPRNTKR